MEGHEFTFPGGEILTGMGATWFVSYAYYEKIDLTHKNWQKVTTYKNRISCYKRGRQYHEYWLHEILCMADDNLKKNKLGLSPSETKAMAKKLLENWK